MIAWFGRLLAPVAGKLLLWGSVAAIGISILFSARRAGREAAERDGLRQQLDNVRVRNEVERNNAVAPGSVADRLRNKWSRD